MDGKKGCYINIWLRGITVPIEEDNDIFFMKLILCKFNVGVW
jgi:hypothetical protein